MYTFSPVFGGLPFHLHVQCPVQAFNVQQNRTKNDRLPLFSRQLAYMSAQITDGAARAVVRNEGTQNEVEILRSLREQFA